MLSIQVCKLISSKRTIVVILAINVIFNLSYPIHADSFPTVNDDNLHVELIINGLNFPTAMDFLGPDDILVLEKDNGTVRRVLSGQLLYEPVLDLNVANKFDRGMLGIAVSKIRDQDIDDKNIYVFIYLTESKNEGSDRCPSWRSCLSGGEPEGNRLYRYTWDGHNLVEPKLILDLPAIPGPAHNGGVVLIGPDNNVYLITGDLRLPKKETQNIRNGLDADGTSGILRLTQDGDPVGNGILGEKHPLNLYYAYGIRNSFGMDFDPLTGKLWDTENGYFFGDEINLVEPGFNSGWAKVQGIWNISKLDEDGIDSIGHGGIMLDPNNLVDFNGKGKYSNPELIWNSTVGLTSLRFVNTDKLGMEYENDMLVGDYYGKIYHFQMSQDRKGIDQREKMADRIVNMSADKNLFARGFDGVTDIKVGPDGNIYVISFYNGTIHRISHKDFN